jgi:hypothetical protein
VARPLASRPESAALTGGSCADVAFERRMLYILKTT